MDYTDLRLITIDDLEEDDVLLTASLVGAPNAANQYMTPKDIAKTVEILQKNCDFHIGGIITNEQGGEATVNGWLQAAVTGLPVVDAPCNGRAHPTGVMGSMNLHKIPDYTYRSRWSGCGSKKSCQSILCQTKLCHWWCQLCN